MNFTAPVVLLSGAEPAPARASSSQMLTEKTVAARLGVTARTLQRWRTTGDGPAWIRIGPRMIRYSEAGVSAWAAARTYAHRAAELAGDVA